MVQEQISVSVQSHKHKSGGKYLIIDSDDFTDINTEKQVKYELSGLITDALLDAIGKKRDNDGEVYAKHHKIVIKVVPHDFKA